MRSLKRFFLIGEHVCPWWLAYSFDNPLRGLIHNPNRMLGSYVRAGMKALDVGCGMGHFSLGLAGLVGDRGRVIAVDLQQKMLDVVARRARQAGLEDRIVLRQCTADDLGVEPDFDIILTFWMVHEVPDVASFMAALFDRLKDDGVYYLAEPRGHVSKPRFRAIVDAATGAGFVEQASPRVRFSRAMVFGKRS